MVKIVAGTDEAGRGPVIGPMVIAGVAISEEKLPKLKKLGVRDSKLLTPKRREDFYDKIINLVDSYSIIEVPAKEIDQRNSVGTNLNKLEAMKIAQIITKLKPDEIYVDSPEPAKGGKKFGYMISQHLNGIKTRIIAEHGADLKYPVASAASILAKVTRDRRVKEIEKEIGYPIGSGYPADPRCKKFLEKEYSDNKHRKHVRTCWSTYKKLKRNKKQSNLNNW